jgi:hypothetical protein
MKPLTQNNLYVCPDFQLMPSEYKTGRNNTLRHTHRICHISNIILTWKSSGLSLRHHVPKQTEYVSTQNIKIWIRIQIKILAKNLKIYIVIEKFLLPPCFQLRTENILELHTENHTNIANYTAL